MADFRVILYPQEPYNVIAPQRYYYTRVQNTDVSGPVTQPETNTHFIGKYRPTVYTSFRFNSRDVEGNTPPVQPETNTHFLGKYRPTIYANLRTLREAPALDSPAGATPQNAEAQPFVILYDYQTYNVVKPGRLFYFQQDVFSLPPTTQPETNVHFVGRFNPGGYTFFVSSYDVTQSTVTAQPETNVHFVGKYQASKYRRPNYFIPDVPFQAPPPVQETNTHFLAKYRPSRYTRPVNLWDTAQSGPLPLQPETNTHFLGRYAPTKLSLWRGSYTNPEFDPPPALASIFLDAEEIISIYTQSAGGVMSGNPVDVLSSASATLDESEVMSTFPQSANGTIVTTPIDVVVALR